MSDAFAAAAGAVPEADDRLERPLDLLRGDADEIVAPRHLERRHHRLPLGAALADALGCDAGLAQPLREVLADLPRLPPAEVLVFLQDELVEVRSGDDAH